MRFLLWLLLFVSSAVAAKVLILGAGVSGIQAGKRLSDLGIDFQILEASDKIGGRIRKTDFEGHMIEEGANWVEGGDDETEIASIAKKIGLQGYYTHQEGQKEGPCIYNSSERWTDEQSLELWRRLDIVLQGALKLSCQRDNANLPDISLRQALNEVGWPHPEQQTPEEQAAEYFVCDWDFEAPPENVSLFGFLSCDSKTRHRKRRLMTKLAAIAPMVVPDDPPRFFVTDPRGYVAVVEEIANQYLQANDTRLQLNTKVVNISIGKTLDGPVSVTTETGAIYTADYVICTFSVGVLKYAFRTQTLFDPPLPAWKTDAFNNVEMGVYTKVFFHFPTKFWDDRDYIVYADDSQRGHFTVWQNLEAPGSTFPANSSIFMVTLVGNESKLAEESARIETTSKAMAVLRQMYGDMIPEPVNMTFAKWYSDELFRGSFSIGLVGNSPKLFQKMQQNVGGLFIAGEGVDPDQNGYVAGGYLSGDRQASAVAERIHKRFIQPLV